MTIKKLIYWHRTGLKVYDINKNLEPSLEKEIESIDIELIKSELKYLKNQSVFLLLADEISYFYEKVIDPPLKLDENFKTNLLEIIKSDIPEDFSQFVWDYKIEDDPEGKQKVFIFAPVKDFYTIINQVSNELSIEIEAIETEFIASQRDLDPIIGIIKKTDISGKDSEILNLSITPKGDKTESVLKKVLIIIIILIGIMALLFLFVNNKSFTTKTSKITPTPTIVIPTETITPTPIISIKAWSELNIMVQNGTTQPGLASKTATIFQDSGITQINSGNADNNDYTSSQLIFQNDSLKETYLDKIKSLVTITDENVKIDTLINYDVIFIKGLN
jgi:hypothetical protein